MFDVWLGRSQRRSFNAPLAMAARHMTTRCKGDLGLSHMCRWAEKEPSRCQR